MRVSARPTALIGGIGLTFGLFVLATKQESLYVPAQLLGFGGFLMLVVALMIVASNYAARHNPPQRRARTFVSTPTVTFREMLAPPTVPTAAGQPGAQVKRFRFSKGFLVFYQYDMETGREKGVRHLHHICALIKEARSAASLSGKHAYDVVLMEIPEGGDEDWGVRLVVTTSDAGPRDQNAILSKLFAHNNPEMEGGQVQQISPAVLRNPSYKVIEEAHF